MARPGLRRCAMSVSLVQMVRLMSVSPSAVLPVGAWLLGGIGPMSVSTSSQVARLFEDECKRAPFCPLARGYWAAWAPFRRGRRAVQPLHLILDKA
jgi:hypothetical protein